MPDAIREILSASQAEQSPVTIFVGNHRLTGTVTAISGDTVEIRHEKSRSAIALRKIAAVSRE